MAGPLAAVSRLFLGRRLSNDEDEQRKIHVFEAIPALGLDGLGSASYGPEAAMSVLAPLGATASGLVLGVMAPVVGLLFVLYLSYRQTIAAYPSNGGAYVVARENLGPRAALLAAAALMIDYVLNVAVGISAGVGALISTLPSLQPYTLQLCLAVLVVVTLANLRGTTEAGRLFAPPTYIFIFGLLVVIALGAWRAVAHHGAPPAIIAPPMPVTTTAGVGGVWLMLRAFAAGCTAMTGVEAVSNGVSAFQEPRVRRARMTLSVICGVLGVLLIGVALLAKAFHIVAMDQARSGYQSVLSQLIAAIMGRGAIYDIIMASVLAVLVLSANTSMVGFPRLCRLVAEDDYLPRAFALAGPRLVYTAGILYLAGVAGLLLIVFEGVTDRLIPLFAVGAFLTFTLSQAGMVAHWLREGGFGSRRRLFINAVGAAVTAAALVIIVVAKFADGAWITVIALPAAVLALTTIHRYYQRLEAALATDLPLPTETLDPPIILALIARWTAPAAHAVSFAMRLSPDVIGLHFTDVSGPGVDEDVQPLEAIWRRCVGDPSGKAGHLPPELRVVSAPYRDVHDKVIEIAAELKATHPERRIAVMIPELLRSHWWEVFFHSGRSHALRERLVADADPDIMIITRTLADRSEDRLTVSKARPAP